MSMQMSIQIKTQEKEQIANCGLCLKLEPPRMLNKCDCCEIPCCDKCTVKIIFSKKDRAGHVYQETYLPTCIICKNLHENCFSTTQYRYCHCCNKIYDKCYFGLKRCIACIADDKNEPDRKTLPHYKAKLVITTYFVPELTQIIYDYYYIPRRYLTGEF